MMSSEKILVTGASGFIGSAILYELTKRNYSCIGIGRKKLEVNNYISCDLFDQDSLRDALQGITCIIHSAGYAHAFSAFEYNQKKEMWRINFFATKILVDLAVELGIKRFINISSVKTMSESNSFCIDECWDLNPISEYGKSKLAAEKMLFKISQSSNINLVNLRLVMVYGRGHIGNLERMANLVAKRLFPPLPETNNKRSIVHIDDVVDVILRVVGDPRSNGHTFIVAGPESPSGRRIYNEIRRAFGLKHVNFEIPLLVLQTLASFFDLLQKISGVHMPFNNEVLSRLLDSAWYSNKKLNDVLDWSPSVTINEGFKRTFGYSLDSPVA